MFQWIKNKLYQRKLKKLKNKDEEMFLLKEKLKEVEILYKIKTKQFNDSMVELKLESDKYKEMLDKEKESNGNLLRARTEEIGKLKKNNEQLETTVKDLEINNATLRATLGHF